MDALQLEQAQRMQITYKIIREIIEVGGLRGCYVLLYEIKYTPQNKLG